MNPVGMPDRSNKLNNVREETADHKERKKEITPSIEWIDITITSGKLKNFENNL